MGTSIEGEWEDVMTVVDACYQELKDDSDRIFLNFKADCKKDAATASPTKCVVFKISDGKTAMSSYSNSLFIKFLARTLPPLLTAALLIMLFFGYTTQHDIKMKLILTLKSRDLSQSNP